VWGEDAENNKMKNSVLSISVIKKELTWAGQVPLLWGM